MRCLGGATTQLSKDAVDLSDDERGLLIAMGLRWGYTPEDWSHLWSNCQDPAKRAAWLATAESEQPAAAPEPEEAEPAVTVRIEADIGSGMKQFNMRVPIGRWDEQKFSDQIAAMPSASWWRLDTPKRCADCRHAQPTQHDALVRCGAGREDYPNCGAWWRDDPKPCREWAPANRTNTRGHKSETESGASQ
ncbi:MAG: hypothetical protein PHT19_08260 [Methylococcus sp.]|nr:hypothetical protein [Methylococcus sp.]